MSRVSEYKFIKLELNDIYMERNDINNTASTVKFRFSTKNTVITALAAYQIIY